MYAIIHNALEDFVQPRWCWGSGTSSVALGGRREDGVFAETDIIVEDMAHSWKR